MQGTILGSRYRVIEYIAKGGFGKTYLAEDIQLPGKDKCVVKQLYPSVDDPNFIKIARRLFKTEAETLHSLGNHDRIPRLLAYFEEDEKFYLVQQYIEGHTLSQELVESKPWSETKVIELLRDCLNILNFIHGKNVIHRDVKPDNLIRRYDNKLVLVDFGSVKEVIVEQTRLVPATVAVGTRGYMPSEQARGKPRTTSDIYALGVIVIQALTGVHPVKLPENNNGEIVWQDRARCSPQLKEIVAKMTRFHFKERYQTAGEITEALNKLYNNPTAPQTEAVKYTPTVQLSGTQMANLAGQPAVSDVTQYIPGDASVLANSHPTESIPEPTRLPQVHATSVPRERSQLIEESNSMPNTQKSGRTLITLGAALAIGAIATGGMYFFNQQSAKTAKASAEEQIAYFNRTIEQQDYKTCYEEAVSIKSSAQTDNSMPQEQLQEFEAQCGLAVAGEEANDLKYSEALAIAKTLPQDTSLETDIKQQIDSWSQQLLEQADELYEQEGNLEEAIALVKEIPQDSAIKPQVIDTKDSWKAETKNNEAILNSAEKALSEENWLYAKQQAIKIDKSSSMYWQEKAKAIIVQAEEGIAATAPQTEVSEPTTTAPAPKPAEPIAPPKNIEPKQPPKTVVTPSVPPEELRDLGDVTPSGELRDLNNGGNSLPGSPSNSAPSDPLRDL